jgi:ATP-dependent Clp protease ATP-binding subunit ClpC
MFERYTERARRLLFFARFEASQFGSRSIEPEHLLLGLLREPSGVLGSILELREIAADDVRRQVAQRISRREQLPTSIEIPFHADTKRALSCAAQEADRLLHNYIGAEHLLLGVLSVDQSPAALLLAERGLRLADARETLVQVSPVRRHPARRFAIPRLACRTSSPRTTCTSCIAARASCRRSGRRTASGVRWDSR